MKYDKHGNPVAETEQDRAAIAAGTARCQDGSLYVVAQRSRIEGMLYRELDLRAEGVIDEDERTVRVSMSSEFPVTRRSFFSDPWIETLGHKRTEVDLTRLNNSASVHYNHSRTRADRIGVVESAKVVASGGKDKTRRVEGVVRISKREDVDDIWTDIKDGILRNVSVGYSINERKLTRTGKDGEPDEYRITKWQPAELSFVDIPADPTVGAGRNEQGELQYRVINLPNEPEKEINNMFRYDANGNPIADTPEARAAILAGTATCKDGSLYVPTDEVRAALTAAPAETPAAAPDSETVDADAIRSEATAAGREQGRIDEAKRVADINAIFAPFASTQDTLRNACVANSSITLDDARSQLLDAIGKTSIPAQSRDAVVEVGESAGEKFVRAGAIALSIRHGSASKDERAAHDNSFAGYSLIELARSALALESVDTSKMSRMELVGRAFTTSDFPLILANVANKSMLKGYDEAPETWNQWAQTGNLSDFKQASRVNLSTFNNLDLVSEDGEYKYGQFAENGENITLATYGKLFAISRQAVINDDLGMFTRIPSAMGRGASRTVGNLAYGVLASNPLMADGVNLFAAGHNNLNVGGALALTADAAGTAKLGAMRNAMGLQTDSGGNAVGLNIRPGFLLVPLALEDTANALMTDTTQPGQANPGVRNQLVNLATVVSDPRLDANSTTRYYMAAGQAWDTIEVAFLDGNQAPTLEQQAGWSIDGTEFKVRIDVAAAPMDFRTWQSNDGV